MPPAGRLSPPRDRAPGAAGVGGTSTDAAATADARGWQRWDLLALTVLAAALRVADLNEQLWLDEIAATLHSFSRSFLSIVTEPASVASHPMYELLARASLLAFGEHPWSVRLPAAIAGTASVPVLYLLVRRVSGRAEALLASGLLALSYHHIFFSQDARGYTLMVLFMLLAIDAALDLRDRPTRGTAARYVVLAVLAAYSVPFGVSIVAGHAAVAAVWLAARARRDGGALQVARGLGPFATAGAVTAVLYAPLVSHTVGIAADNVGQASALHGLRELIRTAETGLGGTPVLVLALAVATVGTVSYARRSPYLLALFLAPVVATGVVLVALRVAVHPRYLFVGVPLGMMVGARGLSVLARAAAPAFLRGRPAVTAAAVAVVALAAATPLVDYYRHPRQDFVGALQITDDLAGPDDRVVGVALAGHAIRDYYRPGLTSVEDLDDLLAVERSARRVYAITTLERVVGGHESDLLDRLHDDYELAHVLAATVDDGEMRIYVGPAGTP